MIEQCDYEYVIDHDNVILNLFYIYRDIIKEIVKAKGIENLRDSDRNTLFRKLLDKPGIKINNYLYSQCLNVHQN